VKCPNPKCNNRMFYAGSKESRQIYKCGRCGFEKVVVSHNSDSCMRGSYLSKDSISKLDRER
jgi:hypothetical protein